jgi:hypothetical protein
VYNWGGDTVWYATYGYLFDFLSHLNAEPRPRIGGIEDRDERAVTLMLKVPTKY